jgi:DNA polymerase III subunit alpha
MSFTHLQWHSTFSFLDAIGKPAQVIKKAKELGMSAVAVTDYMGMYGSINFYQAALKAEIKPIVGVELGFVMDHKTVHEKMHIGNIVLLAENQEGYNNLLKLTSFAHMEWLDFKPKIDLEMLKTYGKHVLALIGGKQSRLGVMVEHGESQTKIQEIRTMICDTLGKEQVYGNIIAQNYNYIEKLDQINDLVLDISKQQGNSCVVNNNFCYVDKADKKAREVALAIKDNKKMYDEDRRKPAGEYHVFSEAEMREMLQRNGFQDEQIDVFFASNQRVADRTDLKIDLRQKLFPNYETPENVREIYEGCKDGLVLES